MHKTTITTFRIYIYVCVCDHICVQLWGSHMYLDCPENIDYRPAGTHARVEWKSFTWPATEWHLRLAVPRGHLLHKMYIQLPSTTIQDWLRKKWWTYYVTTMTPGEVPWMSGIPISGWWFGTFFIFHNIWDNPSHWVIFSRWLKPPTRYRLPWNLPISRHHRLRLSF